MRLQFASATTGPNIRFRAILYFTVPLMLSVNGFQCPFNEPKQAHGYTQINRNGFGYIENLVDMNDYPWGLQYFQPDGSDTGHIYCSTGNGIDDQVLYQIGQLRLPIPPLRPGEVRRYRPDIGDRAWESSLDIRDFEKGPAFETTGFRSLKVYKPDGMPTYLYAGSLSADTALWRSATGEPGDWEKVWSYGDRGSIRAVAVHNGLLYFAVLPGGEIGNGAPGQVWAHDGVDTWPIVEDGFGDPTNGGVWTMAPFNGYLYVSLANIVKGFEVWKMEGKGDKAGPPVRVLNHGGSWRGNYAAATTCVFQDHIYFGTQILGGVNTSGEGPVLRGCDLVRLDKDDNMEIVIGPDSISGIPSGFGKPQNAYVWSMGVYKNQLYVGTWDQTSIIQYAVDEFPQSIEQLLAFLSTDFGIPGFDGQKRAIGNFAAGVTGPKREPTYLSEQLDMGGDVYRTRDGVAWDAVFTDGLGNPYNYGARIMLAHDGNFYIGMANLYEGLEIWKKDAATADDAIGE
ncbi:MAG: hypothetical protein HUU46_08510 [Candidatus Hydrogenedentes bacterium]|nr:hypothetical protein [Candidatus Hydrogenedentota bacterium]